ncbi:MULTISPECIES: ABC transporter permease [unclassified Thalassospira]|uniref:ABC transporter permease n=1 Tax=unclassified Thalassospira TaxID=2648997 RepID=UPI000A1F085A|nr:ABC transporter permease subunit [Thalassospira sp. MCCC 1A01428]OSQ46500.1 ABC transporter permease [Thalassospira sp. MCCC 1A01428]
MSHASFWELMNFGPDGWGWSMLRAAGMTVMVALAGFILGGFIGTFGAWAKIAGNRPVRIAADAYTTILRGIPDLLVIFLFYFGGSLALSAVYRAFGGEGFVDFPGFAAGAMAIGLTSGAQHTEVFRGAYYAIHDGEIEAARAAGMTRMMMLRRIIMPLLLRHALPGLGNIWQVVLKESALVSVTGMIELARQAQIGAGSTRQPFYFFIAAAILFLAITFVSNRVFRFSEAHFSRGVRGAR